MIEEIERFVAWYNDVMENQSDPRVKDMYFMSSPLFTFVVTFLYLVMVAKGPQAMRERPSFKLKHTLIAYNFVTCSMSGYLVYEFLASGWWNDYSLGCQPVDFSNNPKALRMVDTCWLFFFSKFVDLLDTVFFVLRKKNNQLTFLHVMHHGVMPISCWFALKFVPGGFGTFSCMLNSGIHFIMYFYYFLSSFGDTFKAYLKWKKYLTLMQMIQFIVMIIHGSQLIYIECDYPVGWFYWGVCYLIVFLVFFGNFYIQAYIIGQRKATTTTVTDDKKKSK